MNAHGPKKNLALLSLAVLGLGASLSGCAGLFEADTAESPLAPRVQALVAANTTYPQWSDFPRSSSDLPEAAQIRTRVADLGDASSRLEGEVARIEWTLSDTAAFERDIAARVAAVPVSPDAARTEAEIEAYAERLRQRAKAPAAIDRRQ